MKGFAVSNLVKHIYAAFADHKKIRFLSTHSSMANYNIIKYKIFSVTSQFLSATLIFNHVPYTVLYCFVFLYDFCLHINSLIGNNELSSMTLEGLIFH